MMTMRRTQLVVILALCAAGMTAGPAAADLVRDEDAAPATDARAVFELVRLAFENGDQQVLADLVHEDGLRVRSGGADNRDTGYSPSQAYYYFKNLFQSHRTVTFAYLRLEEATVGERVHALARWVHRRPSRDEDVELRLVIVLSRQGDAWRLAEITTIG
jgi:ketosteroid isomerase-like protein